jgi:phosphoglycerate dehydrogenase-like enzyme
MKRLKAGINTTRCNWDWVFPPPVRNLFREYLDFDDSLIAESEDPSVVMKSVEGAEVVLAGWNAVPFTKEILDLCPNLKLILYAAGTVKYFVTDELLRRNIALTSAVDMNAIPVAEFTLGLILSSLKNVMGHHQDFLARGRDAWAIDRPGYRGGYYKTRVGIVGDGRIARLVLDHLKNFSMDVFIASKYFTEEDEGRYGASRLSFEELMKSCDVVTLHHADIPENWNLINKASLALMKRGAGLINTSRGRLINERDLVEKLETGDITAYLDVTHPEPPEADHPFYHLRNCVLTPHIAGSTGREAERMGLFCLEELKRWLAGKPLLGGLDLSGLDERA